MADDNGIRLFPRIDQERVIEQFQIEQTAKTDAVNDYPPSDDSSPSGVQNDVIQFFNEQLRKAKDSALGILSSLSNQRDGIDVDGTLRQIRDIPKNCKIQLDRIRAENEEDLDFHRDEERKQKKDYELFRAQNKLHRIANYPESQIFHYSLIAFFVILETLANAYFFQKGNELGFLGGALQALLVSLANVLISVIVGSQIFIQKNHIVFWRRLTGWVVSAGWLVLLLAFNLLVGHFRSALSHLDQAGQDPASAVWMATETYFQNGPFAINDFEAWVLVLMGATIGLAAFLKGYLSDDEYPGYGGAQRRYRKKRDKKIRRIKEMRQTVKNTIDESLVALETYPSELRRHYVTYGQLLKSSRDVPAALVSYKESLQDVCNAVLSRYQSENQKLRQGDELPSYFGKEISLTAPYELPPVNLGDEDKFLNSLKERLVEVDHVVGEMKDKLVDMNKAEMKELAA